MENVGPEHSSVGVIIREWRGVKDLFLCKGKYKTTSFICLSNWLSIHLNFNMRGSFQSVWCFVVCGGHVWIQVQEVNHMLSTELNAELPWSLGCHHIAGDCTASFALWPSVPIKAWRWRDTVDAQFVVNMKQRSAECAVKGHPEGRRFKPQSSKNHFPAKLSYIPCTQC